MSELSTLTDRDRALVEAGFWPIDVDPPLRISETQLQRMFSPERRARIMELLSRGFVAFSHRGYVAYSKCEAGCDIPKR